MKLTVSAVLTHGQAVRELRLRAPDGAALPAWAAGAHIRLAFGSAGDRIERHYSLVGVAGATTEYRIAVLREAQGRGSRHLHEAIAAGDAIDVEGPFNSFPARAGATRAVLVAGGIGVTPLVSIAHALAAQGVRCTFHYLVSTRERAVLLDELQAIPGLDLVLHVSAEQGRRASLNALPGAWEDGDLLYACGPASLLAGLRRAAADAGWPAGAVQVESFGARSAGTDAPLTIHLAQSDLTLEAAPGATILDTLIDAGVFVAYDCKRGECGNCFTQVTQGIPIHRDVCLTPAQQQVGMCTCVSWAADGRLVLEL